MAFNLLLVTDLDHTLVGDDAATATLNRQIMAARESVCLVYATGRSYGSACQLRDERDLLEPDYWVTGVGSEIYHQGEQDSAWVAAMNQGWDRAMASAIAGQFPALSLQPEAEQNPFKLSFFLEPGADSTLLAALDAQLQASGLATQIIFSSGEDVDILPIAGNKGNAVHYLQQQVQANLESTLVCGDSGNDISLFEQAARGVIVRNARSELLEWYQQFGQPHHYLAQTGYAGGIVEAIEYFALL